MKKSKKQTKFLAPTKAKIILAILIYLLFLYSFVFQSAEFLLYFYFPIIIISSLIAIGLYKIGIPIFYKQTILEDFGFNGKCIATFQKCVGGHIEGFTDFWLPFLFTMTIFYVYLISCFIIIIINKQKKE